jgi:hypothetical protein
MKQRTRLLLTVAAAMATRLAAQPPYTTISDTLQSGMKGASVTGMLNVSWAEFPYGAYTVPQSPAGGVNYWIVNGSVNLQLVPTDHAAGATYTIVTTIGQNSVTTYWQVPTLPSGQCAAPAACNIREVTMATSSPRSSGAWGEISGSLSNQIDLQAALNAKPSGTLVTFIGQPGSDSNIPTEKAVRSVLNSAGGSSVLPVVVYSETPAGVMNGANLVLTLASPPNPATSLELHRNGILLDAGADYSLSGATITFRGGLAPISSDLLQASYQNGYTGAIPANCPPNQVVAGPASGSTAGVSTCRALVAADVPSGGGSSTITDYLPFWFASKDAIVGNMVGSGIYVAGASVSGLDQNPAFYQLPSNGTGYIVIHHMLHPNWTGTIDMALYWTQAIGGTGMVAWDISTHCVGPGGTVYNNSPTYNATQTETVSVPTSNDLAITTQLSLTTTGCAGANLLYVKVQNAAAGTGGTTYTSSVNVFGVALTVRHT